MCKKFGVTALVIVAALFVLHKLELDVWIKHAIKRTQADIKASIPEEARLDDLRDEIAKIGPEIRKAKTAVAKQIGEINELKDEIASIKTNLDKRETALKDLNAELDKGLTLIPIGSDKLPREKVESHVARQWQSFKLSKEMLQSKEDLLKSREESLEAAKATLEAMQDKKKELEADAQRLDLDVRKLRLAQMQQDVPIDDSRVSSAVKKRDALRKQIEQKKIELSLDKGVDSDNAVADALERKAKTEQARKEMKEYFGKDTKITKKD